MKKPPENLMLKILNKKSGKPSNNLFSGEQYEMELYAKENTKVNWPKAGEKIPLEISIEAIKGSNYTNAWVENAELSPDGVMHVSSAPEFPYSGIYRMVAKSKNTDNDKNLLHGFSVVNVL